MIRFVNLDYVQVSSAEIYSFLFNIVLIEYAVCVKLLLTYFSNSIVDWCYISFWEYKYFNKGTILKSKYMNSIILV